MRKMLSLLIASVMLLSTILMSGCTSKTMIHSDPEGAKLFVDGQYVGKTPVDYGDTAISGTQKNIRLEKPGYQQKTAVIRKEDVQAGPIVGGIFLLVPFIWSLGYPDQYMFELHKGSNTAVNDTAKK